MELKNQILEVSRNDEWQIVNIEDLRPGEVFRVKPLENKLTYRNYVHSDKGSNYDKAREFGLDNDKEFMDKFAYSLYEIELDMEVDTKTGESWILGIEGVKLEKPVKS